MKLCRNSAGSWVSPRFPLTHCQFPRFSPFLQFSRKSHRRGENLDYERPTRFPDEDKHVSDPCLFFFSHHPVSFVLGFPANWDWNRKNKIENLSVFHNKTHLYSKSKPRIKWKIQNMTLSKSRITHRATIIVSMSHIPSTQKINISWFHKGHKAQWMWCCHSSPAFRVWIPPQHVFKESETAAASPSSVPLIESMHLFGAHLSASFWFCQFLQSALFLRRQSLFIPYFPFHLTYPSSQCTFCVSGQPQGSRKAYSHNKGLSVSRPACFYDVLLPFLFPDFCCLLYRVNRLRPSLPTPKCSAASFWRCFACLGLCLTPCLGLWWIKILQKAHSFSLLSMTNGRAVRSTSSKEGTKKA